MKDYLKYITYIVVAVFLFLTVRTVYTTMPEKEEESEVSVHDSTWTEAVTNVPPRVHDSIIKEYVPYPVPVYLPGDKDTVRDTVTVMVPITQKLYSFEDNANLWISGFNVTIDSSVFYKHYETQYIDRTIREKRYNNTIGVIGGVSDVSLMYVRDIGRVSVGLSAGYTFKGEAMARGFVGWKF